ncbi:MAG: hypothetical protein GY817_00115 [bacterium]|nr:hypothetical protein [bacterium]
MRIKITSRNYKLKANEQDYLEEKVQNFTKFMDIDHVDIIIKEESYEYVLEVILKAMHKNFIMKKKGSSLAEVTDILVDKISHQLGKHKERVKSHRKEKSQIVLDEVGADNPYSLIYRSLESLEEYTHAEAADKLILSESKFLVYLDSYTKHMSVAVLKDSKTIEFIES